MTRGATRGSVLTTWRFWVRSIGSESPGAGVRVKRRARAPVARRNQPPNKMPAVDAAPPIVDARGLCKDYGARRVVTDVSFALARGECLGLLNRKSTRLNSSHLGISYAVFCLKKKNEK